MSFKMVRVHVWSGEVNDQPGGIAGKLATLAEAGANLEYVYTQRIIDKPGFGALYVSPLTGPDQLRAAKAVGLHETEDPIVMRFEGDNKQGLAHQVALEWAKHSINLHGLTMSVLGNRFVGYATFDSVADANQAATILADLENA